VKNVLIMGKTQDICDGIARTLTELCFENITTLQSGCIARAENIEKFDAIIISTPLSDEFGLDFVAEISKKAKNGVVVLAKSEIADEVQKKLKFTGAFVIARPFGKSVLIQAIKFSQIAKQSMARLEEENESLSRQLSDVKIISRAKSLLMKYLGLTEEQAHRHIQKQAMDMRKSQREIAEDVLKTYHESSDMR